MAKKVHVLHMADNNSVYNSFSINASHYFLSERQYGGVAANITPDIKFVDVTLKDVQDKSFYRYPKLALPRMKVDLLKEKASIKVVRDKDTADYKIISDKYLESLTEYSWNNTYKAGDLLAKLEANSAHFTINTYDTLKTLFEDNPDDLFVVKDGWSYSRSFTFTTDVPYHTSNYRYVSEENIQEFEDIIKSTNLVLDKTINGLIYEDMHALTKEEYLNARNMIKSEDMENRVLVLELLSNCNLNKSFDYVALLFYFYYDYLKDAKNWNSVNVKTLRKSMEDFQPGYSNSTYGQYYDNFLRKLLQHDHMTEFAFKEVARYTFHNVVKKSMGLQAESMFTIDLDAIKLNPLYVERLKKEPSFFLSPVEEAVLKF